MGALSEGEGQATCLVMAPGGELLSFVIRRTHSALTISNNVGDSGGEPMPTNENQTW